MKLFTGNDETFYMQAEDLALCIEEAILFNTSTGKVVRITTNNDNEIGSLVAIAYESRIFIEREFVYKKLYSYFGNNI